MDNERDEWFFEELVEAIEESDKEIDEIDVEEITMNSIEHMAEEFYEEVGDDFSDVEHYRGEIEGFEERLYDHWEEAFDKLEQLILRCFDFGAEINHEHRFEAAQDDDYMFEALTHLHSRACQIAFEILTLLKHGFADGAFARWRSLHEVAVVAIFIKKHGQETAERFLLFENIETYYFAQNYIEHHEELGYEQISEDVIEELEERKEILIDRFGEAYDREFRPGWALHVFDSPQGGMRRLEKEAGLQHLRPFYRLASKSVHGTPKGTLNRVGIVDLPDVSEQRNVLPAGPTNAGFADPASLTAISLSQVTSALATLKSSVVRSVSGLVIQMLVEDVDEIFVAKENDLKEQEREALEEWANMDIPDIAQTYVGFKKLLTDEFLLEHSKFDSLQEFVEAAPLDVDSLDELNQENSEEFDDFIAANTDFESGDELAEEAFEVWVLSEDDTDEFSFEE